MPIVLVANEEMKKAIEQICVLLARTYKNKIIHSVPQLQERCQIDFESQVFDTERIAGEIGNLAVDPNDSMFLQ